MRCPTLAELPPSRSKTGWPWTEESPQLPGIMTDGQSWPRISIVTPSYNQGEFLEETIRSVLLQGYPNLEYIIIDGGSTDKTLEVIKRYEPWLAYWVSEKDGGQANAINKGWKIASGSLLSWINSDDILNPGSLASTLDCFNRTGSPDLAFCSAEIINEVGIRTGTYCVSMPTLREMITFWNCPLPQQGFLMRREVLEKCGFLNESLFFAMDFEYWIRCCLAGMRFGCAETVGAKFRVHKRNKTSAQHHRYVQDMQKIVSTIKCSNVSETVRQMCEGSLEIQYANAARNADAWGLKSLIWRYSFKDLRFRGLPALSDSLPLAFMSMFPGNGRLLKWLYYGIKARCPKLSGA